MRSFVGKHPVWTVVIVVVALWLVLNVGFLALFNVGSTEPGTGVGDVLQTLAPGPAAPPAKTPRKAARRTRACLVKAGVTRIRWTDGRRGLIARFPGPAPRQNPWGYRWASVTYSGAGTWGVVAAKMDSGDLTVRQRRLWKRCTNVVD